MSPWIRRTFLTIGLSLFVAQIVAHAGVSQAIPPKKPLPSNVTVVIKVRGPSIQRTKILDPFQIDPSLASASTTPSSSSTTSNGSSPTTAFLTPNVVPGSAASHVPQLGPLSVPNPDGSMPTGGSTGGFATYTLQATLLGSPSLAVFQSGNDTEIVPVGKKLGDRTIAKITMGEVIFSDGSRIGIATTNQSGASGASGSGGSSNSSESGKQSTPATASPAPSSSPSPSPSPSPARTASPNDLQP